MTVRELREKYLKFFESKGHQIFPSGSLIPIDVTGRLDESLLFNGAGMVQFKPYFRGIAKPESLRLTTAQKCVRTGDIEEVGNLSHLTFFEMMGNFSFGDYFKLEAIDFSWEFLTSSEWLGLDPTRLSFTVFEDDSEAYEQWSKHVRSAGIDPETRIFRLGEDTNYWPAGAFSNGPPGPCGPNSEMFYWTSKSAVPGIKAGDYSTEQWLHDDNVKNWLEIWNDVFIQYEWQGELKNPAKPSDGYAKLGMPNLPFKSIDTGMGLERTVAVLEGKNSVYETDAFLPIFAKIQEIQTHDGDNKEQARAKRIIADHIRTACFCIIDGILPGNTGRGYVLRRLIRRSILKGQRQLGFNELFLYKIYEGVVEAMGSHYTELEERRDVIVETLRNEEALFRRTLDRGIEMLGEKIEKLHKSHEKTLDGADAFQLYDTFGFPLEVTIEICNEANIRVDEEGYEVALKEAQDRSRGSQDRESVYGGVASAEELALENAATETVFLGYTQTESDAIVARIRQVGDSKFKVALDQTPFYAESGGQSGDTGWLILDGYSIEVHGTTKSNGIFWHEVELKDGPELLGKTVSARVDVARRAKIKRNHTATHLLQAALRQTLGNHVTQAGSFVGPDNLRFDFTHGKAMTPDEVSQVEHLVIQEALANRDVVTYADLPIAEAKAKGAMALFGEKYGDKVRMVEIGDFSRELCGGIHVRTSAEIGLFKVINENSAASGVRRIEAITGEAAIEYVQDELTKIKEAANLLKSNPKDLLLAIQKTVDQAREEKKKREKAELSAMSGGTAETNTLQVVHGVDLWVKNLGAVDPKIASQSLDNESNGKPNQVTLVAVMNEDKIQFMCKVGDVALAKGAHAGNLLKEVARVAGGGGGGQSKFATAGGKDPSKVAEALESASKVLESQLS